MPAPANLERDHLIVLNNDYGAPLTAANQLYNVVFRIYELLTAPGVGAWVSVAGSGFVGGVWVAGTGATRWPAVTALAAAAPGSNHAWNILQGPSGQQMLIDLSVVGTESVHFDFARPTDQFSLAGLSTTNAPAAPTSALYGGATVCGGPTQIIENTAGVDVEHVNVWRDDAGSFIVGCGHAGDGFLNFHVYCLVLSTSGPGYTATVATNPFVFGVHYGGGNDAFDRTRFSGGSISGGWSSAGDPITIEIDPRNNAPGQGPTGTVAGDLIRHPMDAYSYTPELAYRGRVPDYGVFPGAPAQNDRETSGHPLRAIVVGNLDLLTNGGTAISM